MKLVLFHMPEGDDVWINPDAIIKMFPADDTVDERAHAILALSDGHQAVKETVPEVIALVSVEGIAKAREIIAAEIARQAKGGMLGARAVEALSAVDAALAAVSA